MRKTTVLAAILALCLTACSVNVATPSYTESDTSSALVNEEKSTMVVSSSQALTESISTSTTSNKPALSSSSSVVPTSASSRNPAQSSPKAQTATETTQEKPQSSPTITGTPAPQPEQPPAPATAPPPAPVPAPVPPPAAPKTAYDAPYDTGTISADAAAYGNALGMTWSDGLDTGNCSWEAPISTSAVLCGDRLKEAIQSGIRRVQKLQQDNGYQAGEFHFKVHLEPSGSEYTIYFLMG